MKVWKTITGVKMKRIQLLEKPHNPAIDEMYHQLNLCNIGNVIYWKEFFDMSRRIMGDIVECGIGRGRSLSIISCLNYLLDKEEGGQRKIYGYDSFEGFPEPTKEDKSPRNPKKGEWASSPSGKYKYTKEFITDVISASGVPINEMKIDLIKGYFSESLKTHPDRPIAILHLDGDLYQSYMDPLKLLYDKVGIGGVIIFDDFLFEKGEKEDFPGARCAVMDFFKDKYKDIKCSICGTPYLIKD